LSGANLLDEIGFFFRGVGRWDGFATMHAVSYAKSAATKAVAPLWLQALTWLILLRFHHETFAKISRQTRFVSSTPDVVMKSQYIFFAAALATAVSLFAAPPATSSIHVEVTFDHPEKFTDVKDSSMGTDKGRDSTLELFKEYLQERAPRFLAEGQTLAIVFTDIDLAGEFEPQRGPRFDNVRIIKDIYPPRLTFTYKLTDASGAVLKEGHEKLVDLSFQMTGSVIDNNDPLHYEKSMLNDWLHNQFKHPKKSAAGPSSNS
jgi:hypothetical protein